MKGPVTTKVGGRIIVWSTIHETAIGGFTLDTSDLVTDQVIPAGTPLTFNESTRVAKIVKMATLYADAANNATVYQVKKGHTLSVGNILGYTAGGAAYAISGINTANANYDAVTLGTTLGVALTTGADLFQSAGAGASVAAFIGGTPKGCLMEETTVSKDVSVSAVLKGTMYARRVPVNNPSLQTALSPSIIFSQSK